MVKHEVDIFAHSGLLSVMWEPKHRELSMFPDKRDDIESLANNTALKIIFYEAGLNVNEYQHIGMVVSGQPHDLGDHRGDVYIPTFTINSDGYLDLDLYDALWRRKNSL